MDVPQELLKTHSYCTRCGVFFQAPRSCNCFFAVQPAPFTYVPYQPGGGCYRVWWGIHCPTCGQQNCAGHVGTVPAVNGGSPSTVTVGGALRWAAGTQPTPEIEIGSAF